MKPTCQELRDNAWKALEKSGGYWYAVLLLLIVTAIIAAASGVTGGVLGLLALPMTFAYNVEILKLDREGKVPQIESIFNIYRDNFQKSFLVTFLIELFVLLWALLFIVPGIIMAYAYSMSIYIAHDNPELTAMEAIQKSKEMMRGHKWDLFVLDLSFIGWILLCCLTFGLGFILLQPYIDTAHAEFYRNLIGESNDEVKTNNAEA